MPTTPAPYVRRPYAGDGLIRLADLGLQSARMQSNAVRYNGQQSAQAWSRAGQGISDGIGAIREERVLLPLREAAARKLAYETEQMRRGDEQYAEGRQAKAADAQKIARLKQLGVEYQGQRIPTDVLIKEFGAADASQIDKMLDELFPKPEAPKTREVKVRNADGSESIQIVKDEPGQSFSSAAEKPKLHPVTVPGPDGRPITKMVTEEELIRGVPAYRDPKAPPAERAKFWIMRDGKALRVSEDEYRPGDQPASTREQGRPVTSGDAGRIADFDTSLDDLSVLGSVLASAGSTGAAAKIGASVPNWVTEYTGWGSDAKKKQALIDRVKQVIGKALEGGVLRKEDEVKYEKILPTVGDPNELVVSKLSGLGDAIKLRRTRTIESLTDAGYDTTKFGEYKSATPAAGGTVRMRAPNGQEQDVPADQVAHYKSLGATEVKKP